MVWSAADIVIDLDNDLTDGSVATVTVTTPDGTLVVMAVVDILGRLGMFRDIHLHGVTLGANEFGLRRLRWVARAMMEAFDLDEAVIVGAARTSGAGPGHRPRPLRFARKAAAAADGP